MLFCLKAVNCYLTFKQRSYNPPMSMMHIQCNANANAKIYGQLRHMVSPPFGWYQIITGDRSTYVKSIYPESNPQSLDCITTPQCSTYGTQNYTVPTSSHTHVHTQTWIATRGELMLYQSGIPNRLSCAVRGWKVCEQRVLTTLPPGTQSQASTSRTLQLNYCSHNTNQLG